MIIAFNQSVICNHLWVLVGGDEWPPQIERPPRLPIHLHRVQVPVLARNNKKGIREEVEKCGLDELPCL
jgi:hypothetical protein